MARGMNIFKHSSYCAFLFPSTCLSLFTFILFFIDPTIGKPARPLRCGKKNQLIMTFQIILCKILTYFIQLPTLSKRIWEYSSYIINIY